MTEKISCLTLQLIWISNDSLLVLVVLLHHLCIHEIHAVEVLSFQVASDE